MSGRDAARRAARASLALVRRARASAGQDVRPSVMEKTIPEPDGIGGVTVKLLEAE